MRTSVLSTVALACLLFFTSCEKENAGSINCEKIRAGILANNTEAVRKEIDGYTFFLQHDPAASDPYGHRLNIEKLVQVLNGDCNFSVTAGCYNCIKTNPPQTELFITVQNGATTVRKVIDLSYSSSRRLIFSGMHD